MQEHSIGSERSLSDHPTRLRILSLQLLGLICSFGVVLIGCQPREVKSDSKPEESPKEFVTAASFFDFTGRPVILTENHPRDWSDAPISVQVTSQNLTLTRHFDGPPTKYLTFESSAGRQNYGAYSLAGPKNGIPVSRPLSGETVTWDDKDHEQALVYLLGMAGGDRGDDLLNQHRSRWFSDGLRVFVVLHNPIVEVWGPIAEDQSSLLLVLELQSTPRRKSPQTKNFLEHARDVRDTARSLTTKPGS